MSKIADSFLVAFYGLVFAVLGVLATVLFVLAIGVPVFWLEALVIKYYWGWFVVPFFTEKTMSLSVAFGFSLFISALRSPEIIKKDYIDNKKVISGLYVVPLVMLAFGYFVERFII